MVLGGSIHILCNNAGVPATVSVIVVYSWCFCELLYFQAGWRINLDVMLVGASNGIFLAMERLSKQNGGEGGRIINTGSVAGLTVRAHLHIPSKMPSSKLHRHFIEF